MLQEELEHLVDLFRRWHHDNRLQHILGLQVREIDIIQRHPHQVFCMEHTDQIVPVAAIDGDSTVTQLPESLHHLG